MPSSLSSSTLSMMNQAAETNAPAMDSRMEIKPAVIPMQVTTLGGTKRREEERRLSIEAKHREFPLSKQAIHGELEPKSGCCYTETRGILLG